MENIIYNTPKYITNKDIISYTLDNDYDTHIEISEYTEEYNAEYSGAIKGTISIIMLNDIVKEYNSTPIEEINKIVSFIESNQDILSSFCAYMFNRTLRDDIGVDKMSNYDKYGIYRNYGYSRQERMDTLEEISPKLRKFAEPLFDGIINKIIETEVQRIESQYAVWRKNDSNK